MRDTPLYTLPNVKSNFTTKMNAPFAERAPHVVQFELTTGCSHSKCSFCTMYSNTPHTTKSLESFEEHVNSVFKDMTPEQIDGLQKIFIGGGNALHVDHATLNKNIQYTIKQFNQFTGRFPKRVSMYGNTNDILKHEETALKSLVCGDSCCHSGKCTSKVYGKRVGLNLVYWGIESGSTNVLKYVDKGYTKKQILTAGGNLENNSIDASVMIIPGLGGKEFEREHLEETLDILNYIKPKFVTFVGINPDKTSRYYKKMKTDGNRPLTTLETSSQMIKIIMGMTSETQIGCFGEDKQRFGKNALEFGSFTLPLEKERALDLVQSRFCEIFNAGPVKNDITNILIRQERELAKRIAKAEKYTISKEESESLKKSVEEVMLLTASMRKSNS